MSPCIQQQVFGQLFMQAAVLIVAIYLCASPSQFPSVSWHSSLVPSILTLYYLHMSASWGLALEIILLFHSGYLVDLFQSFLSTSLAVISQLVTSGVK